MDCVEERGAFCQSPPAQGKEKGGADIRGDFGHGGHGSGTGEKGLLHRSWSYREGGGPGVLPEFLHPVSEGDREEEEAANHHELALR